MGTASLCGTTCLERLWETWRSFCEQSTLWRKNWYPFFLFIKNTIKQEKQLSFIFKPGCLTSPSCTVGTDWAILWLFPLDFLLVVLFFKVVKSWLQNDINVRLKDARQRNIRVLQKHPHILIMNFCLSCRFGKSQEAKRTSGFCLRPTWPYREPTRWFWRPRWGGRLET